MSIHDLFLFFPLGLEALVFGLVRGFFMEVPESSSTGFCFRFLQDGKQVSLPEKNVPVSPFTFWKEYHWQSLVPESQQF
jgi:hypothetical protein